MDVVRSVFEFTDGNDRSRTITLCTKCEFNRCRIVKPYAVRILEAAFDYKADDASGFEPFAFIGLLLAVEPDFLLILDHWSIKVF